MRVRAVAGYREARARRYPPIGDQLDAVAKLAAALRDQGVVLPADTQAWLDEIQAVKTELPKIEEKS